MFFSELWGAERYLAETPSLNDEAPTEDILRRWLWTPLVPPPILGHVTDLHRRGYAFNTVGLTDMTSIATKAHEYLVPSEMKGRHTRIAALSLGTLRDVASVFRARCRHEYRSLYENCLTTADEKGAETARELEPVSLAMLAPGIWHYPILSYYRPMQDMRDAAALYNDTYQGNVIKVRLSGSKLLTP
jgi:hypothetical protein